MIYNNPEYNAAVKRYKATWRAVQKYTDKGQPVPESCHIKHYDALYRLRVILDALNVRLPKKKRQFMRKCNDL